MICMNGLGLGLGLGLELICNDMHECITIDQVLLYSILYVYTINITIHYPFQHI
jgi:hypothetical protein